MNGRALTVLHGGGPSRLSRADAVPRLRPGDRPVAVDLALASSEVRTLRARVHELGLGVDAFVAVVLEYDSLCDLVGGRRVAEIGAEREASPDGVFERLVAPELRSWHRLLAARSIPAIDDLPTVYVPLRLAASLPPTSRAGAVARALRTSEIDARRAVALEAAATAVGLMMQTWVLWKLVASASGGAPAAL